MPHHRPRSSTLDSSISITIERQVTVDQSADGPGSLPQVLISPIPSASRSAVESLPPTQSSTISTFPGFNQNPIERDCVVVVLDEPSPPAYIEAPFPTKSNTTTTTTTTTSFPPGPIQSGNLNNGTSLAQEIVPPPLYTQVPHTRAEKFFYWGLIPPFVFCWLWGFKFLYYPEAPEARWLELIEKNLENGSEVIGQQEGINSIKECMKRWRQEEITWAKRCGWCLVGSMIGGSLTIVILVCMVQSV